MNSRKIVQDYRISLAARLGAGTIALFSAATALSIATALLFAVQHPIDPKATVVRVDLIFAPPLILAALFVIWRFVQQCSLRATIDTDGMTIRTLRRQTALRWETVTSLRVDAPRTLHPVVLIIMALCCPMLLIPYLLSRLSPRLRYSLTLATGETVRIPPALAAKTSIVDAIDYIVAQRLFPAAVARYESGLPSDFGAFMIDAAGIHAGKKMLPWSDVSRVSRNTMGIAVFSTVQRSPWATARLKVVPTPALFETLTAAVLASRDGYVRDLART